VSLAGSILGRWAPIVEALDLRAASHGRFEVRLDGRLVFDTRALDRLPEPGEVESLLEADLGPALDWR
jgi:Rdx family protein